ncbi:MAG: MMPL family transporter [Bacteroidales bacterium]|nr:MMPL family transporter [Bacteroidales bacterium]
MKSIAKATIKLRWLILILVVGLTTYLAYQIKDMHINSDVVSSLPDDDPAASLYKDIGEKFGGNYMGMIILETEDVFQTKTLEHVKQITDSLLVSEGVSTVTSLTNIIDIKSSEFGIEIGKLVDEYDLPVTEDELKSLKDRVMSKEMYKGNIVSEDGKATLIMFTLLNDVDKQTVAKNIKYKILKIGLQEKLYFGGIPMMINDIEDLIATDIIRLIPVVILLMIIILFLSFRSFRGVLLPLLSAGISVIWTLGIMVLLNYDLTLITNNMPIILLAVGTAYTIHVLNRIDKEMQNDPKKAIIKGLSYVMIPVILAALTTVIGFVSFIFGAYLIMIRDFGLFTALGTFLALLLSIFFVPALTSIFLSKIKKKEINNDNRFMSKRILKPLVNLLFKHPKYTLNTWIILLLISIGGIFLIKTSVNMQLYFKKNNSSRLTEDILQKDFGGSQPVFVVFKGDMQSPEVLKMMKKTQNYMKANPQISMTQSVADLIEDMNDAMEEGKRIPDEKEKIEQLWFLLEGQDIMSQLVTYELDEGIIQSKFASSDSEDMEKFIAYMNVFINKNSSENCKIELTGMPSVYTTMNNSLINSQFSSLAIAIIMVLIIIGIMLKSFSKGIYAVIPIISTIIILFGFMGYTGISLDIATVLVASVALGIGIDYSIHVITHFNHSFKETNNINKALEDTIMISGKAILINVLSVTGGFLVLLFSQMVPLQNFGLLVAISMIGSGMGSLTLLPVILILTTRKKINN